MQILTCDVEYFKYLSWASNEPWNYFYDGLLNQWNMKTLFQQLNIYYRNKIENSVHFYKLFFIPPLKKMMHFLA